MQRVQVVQPAEAGAGAGAAGKLVATRVNRHGEDILERPIYKPLDSYQDFTPTKTCAEECAEALPTAAVYIPKLVEEGKKVAQSVLDAGLGKRLKPMQVFALVCYTMDIRGFGGNLEQNFYHALNKTLQKRDPVILRKLAGYLHFFLTALKDLPKEEEGILHRGVTSEAVAVVKDNYATGRTIHWSGVTSVSKDHTVAADFAGQGGVVFRIRAFSGVSVENFSVMSESEVILQPNFKAFVARPLYQEAAYPGLSFIDLVEVKSEGSYIF